MESVMSVGELNRVAEVDLVYRNFIKPSQRPQVTAADVAYKYFLQSWNSDRIEFVEEFKLMLLNRSGRVLGILSVSTGGVSGTIADPKIIFAAALKANASALILAHNHPSGNLQPSQADIGLTRKIAAGGQLLEISVNDHLIITSEGYYSFAEEGLL